MSLKKFATALLVGGAICNLIGCGATTSGNKTACASSTEYMDSSMGVPPVSSFAGEVMTPEQELALLNQKVVHFAYDDAALTQPDQRVLGVHAKYMLENQNIAILIKGHTDERGSGPYNRALGERRAKSVARFLETKGVPANRITTVSYGKEQPVALESNEAAWAQNRRAELDYEDVG